MGAGLVAGIVIGCVVAVALLAAAVYYAVRCRKTGPNLCAGIFFDKTDFEAACGAGAHDLNTVVLGEQPTPPCAQGREGSAGKLGAGCEQADEHFSTPVTCDVAASAAGAGSPFAPSPSVPPAAPPAPASAEPPRKALPAAACDTDAADSHCVVVHATSVPPAATATASASAAAAPPAVVTLDTTELAETASCSSSHHTPPLGVPAAAAAAAATASASAAAAPPAATPLSPSIPAVPDLRVPAHVAEAAAAEAAAAPPPALATGLRPPSASTAPASAATAPTGFSHQERHNHDSLRQLEREIFPAEQRAPETFRCVEIVDSAAECAAAAAAQAPSRQHLPPPAASAELLGSLPPAAAGASSSGHAGSAHALPATRQRTPGTGTPGVRREVPTFNLSVAMGSAGVHLQSRPMGAAPGTVTPVLRDPEGTPMFAGGGYPAAAPPAAAGASHQTSALPPLHGSAGVTTPRAFAAQRQAAAFRADGGSALGGGPAASALSASGSLRGKEGSVGSGLSARFAGSVVLPGGASSVGGHAHAQHGGRHSAVPPPPPPATTSSQGGLAPAQGGGQQGTVVRKRAASLLAHLAKDGVPGAQPAAHNQSFSRGSAIENIHVVPPPVVTAEGAIMRTTAPGMGSVLKKNPFYFCLLMEEWERRCGLDGGPLPSPVMHRIPDDGGRGVSEEDWALLDEANRLREGGDSTYWSVFLNEVERLQHNRR